MIKPLATLLFGIIKNLVLLRTCIVTKMYCYEHFIVKNISLA